MPDMTVTLPSSQLPKAAALRGKECQKKNSIKAAITLFRHTVEATALRGKRMSKKRGSIKAVMHTLNAFQTHWWKPWR